MCQTFFLCPPHLLLSKIPFFIYLSKTLTLAPVRNFTSDRDSAHVISNDHPVIVPQDHIDRVSFAEIVAIENNNGEVYQEMGVQIFEDYVGKYLADRVIRILIFTVLFIVFYAFLHIIIVWLDLISRLPIIYGLNKIAGAVLGLTEALIFIWVGALVLTLFSGSEIGKSMITQINGSIWLTWLYDHNMLSYLVVGLVKSVL